MKIGLFTHVRYPFTNGVAISVEQLATTLKLRNHEVTIISNNYEKFGNDFSTDKDFRIISFPIFYQNLRTPVLFNPSLLEELAKINLDVVHSHSDFGLGVLARVYSKVHDTPLIHTYHCDYLGYAQENFGRFSRPIFHEPVKLYTKALCHTADRIIVPSLETKRLLTEDFSVNKKLDFIPNGVDLSKFDKLPNERLKEKLGITEEDFVLLSLSRLSKEKGIANIISLLPRLNDCPKLKFVIVGGGPQEQELKELVNNLSLDNVIFTGEIPFDQVQDYYGLGDVFITNSKAETQGLSVIEALASSLPAICPNTPIYRELINDCDNGFLYISDDELIEFLKVCYFNQEILPLMSQRAKESTYQFSLSETVDKIEDIYLEEQNKNLRKRYNN